MTQPAGATGPSLMLTPTTSATRRSRAQQPVAKIRPARTLQTEICPGTYEMELKPRQHHPWTRDKGSGSLSRV